MDIATMVIEVMGDLLNQVYAIVDNNPALQEWADSVIQDAATRTENQIGQQLRT